MNYILQTNSLTKKYKNFQALNGLTMNVPKGSIYGFVGKNGAGKTTLIRLICGLQEPTSGSFSLYGIRNDSKDIIPPSHGCCGGNTVHLHGYDCGGKSEAPVSHSWSAII